MIADSGSEDIRSQALDLRTCHSLQCPEGTCGVRPNPRLGCRGLQRDPGRRGTIHGTRHIHAADRTIPDHPGRPPWQTTLAGRTAYPTAACTLVRVLCWYGLAAIHLMNIGILQRMVTACPPVPMLASRFVQPNIVKPKTFQHAENLFTSLFVRDIVIFTCVNRTSDPGTFSHA